MTPLYLVHVACCRPVLQHSSEVARFSRAFFWSSQYSDTATQWFHSAREVTVTFQHAVERNLAWVLSTTKYCIPFPSLFLRNPSNPKALQKPGQLGITVKFALLGSTACVGKGNNFGAKSPWNSAKEVVTWDLDCNIGTRQGEVVIGVRLGNEACIICR